MPKPRRTAPRVAFAAPVDLGSDEDFVLVRRSEYLGLLARSRAAEGRRAPAPTEAEEDAGTARIVAESRAAVAAGSDVELPADVAFGIAEGENPVRALRKWRGLTLLELHERASVPVGQLSDLENGKRGASTAAMRRIADALGVPLDLLVA